MRLAYAGAMTRPTVEDVARRAHVPPGSTWPSDTGRPRTLPCAMAEALVTAAPAVLAASAGDGHVR